jgi:hypothetical protein
VHETSPELGSEVEFITKIFDLEVFSSKNILNTEIKNCRKRGGGRKL